MIAISIHDIKIHLYYLFDNEISIHRMILNGSEQNMIYQTFRTFA